MPPRFRRALLAAALALCAPAVPLPGLEAGPAPKRGPALEEWYRGPVRYLIRRKEEKAFRALDNDAARALFIRDFWRVRDPDPSSPENEARLAFWQRVAEATRLFNESGRPGWLTDRGRIHILLGAPDDIHQDLNFRVDRDRRGLVRWIYHGRVLTGRSEPTFAVAFTMDPSGEWRLSNDSRLSSVFFDPMSAAGAGDIPYTLRLQSVIADAHTDLGVAMDLARMTTAPQDEVPLIETVASEAFYGTLPVTARWDCYPGPGDGRTLVVATVFIPKAELSASRTGGMQRPLVLARLEGAEQNRVDLGEGAFALPEEGVALESAEQGPRPPPDLVMLQAKTLAPPGAYASYVGVFDRYNYRAGSSRAPVEVCAFPPERLEISPITPALSITPVARGADRGYALPFVLGELRVLPREKPAFPRSEEMAVYFQISAPAGVALSSLELRFHRVDRENLIPVGKPRTVAEPSAVQGWTFPLADWPPGEYRLTVTVLDAADRIAARSLDFTITE